MKFGWGDSGEHPKADSGSICFCGHQTYMFWDMELFFVFLRERWLLDKIPEDDQALVGVLSSERPERFSAGPSPIRSRMCCLTLLFLANWDRKWQTTKVRPCHFYRQNHIFITTSMRLRYRQSSIMGEKQVSSLGHAKSRGRASGSGLWDKC